MPTAIQIDDLVKTYTPGVQPAVDHVTLCINPGELFFLLGPSGCGKTTLLRMIAGFIDPTSGRIGFATGAAGGVRDVTNLPPNERNTGMVFQSYALWPHMSVFDNVAFGLTIRKVSKAEIARRVGEALEMVQMGHLAQRKPNALSGGQQQRVALARALVVRPDVLLLDEPLSNLDAKLRTDLRSEIRRICKGSGITTVYVTHDQKEALSMADAVAIMQSGKVVQQGAPGELYRRPKSRFVAEFLGEANFIPGTIAGAPGPGGRVSVQTAIGTLQSGNALAGVAGGGVVISIRPEAFRLSAGGGTPGGVNQVRGEVVEGTYLGEIAQYAVRVGDGSMLKVAHLNPGMVGLSARSQVALEVDAEDVVLLPGG